jgi:hypothetical protein
VNFKLTRADATFTILDPPVNTLTNEHKFFGVVDTAGFETFEVFETEGTTVHPQFVFGDDFTIGVTGAADTVPPRVTHVGSWEDTGDGSLAEGEVTDVAITQLFVTFDEVVQDHLGDSDPNDVTNPANYLLLNDGGNGFQTVDCAGGVAAGDTSMAVNLVTWISGTQLEATLDLNGGLPLPAGTYRLLVCGTTSILDWSGNPLDGDGNGAGGDDFQRNFVISSTPVNHPPVANNQAVTTAEDTPKVITLTASDVDLDPLTFGIVTGPTHGTLSGSPPGVTYTSAPNYHGGDSFTFRAFDGALFSNTATVSITITPVNDPPVAVDQAVTTPQDTPVAITLAASDVDLDPLTFAILTGPSHGTLSGSPPDVTYTPATGYSGADSFTFRAWDGSVFSNAATVSVTVTPVTPLPQIAIDDVSLVEGGSGTVSAVFTVTVTGSWTSTVTVDFATADGSAAAGSDYLAASGPLAFPPGTATRTVNVAVLGDSTPEEDETFFVDLANPVNATLSVARGTATILNDDPWSWFVAPTGSAANDCLSPSTPCAGIQDAIGRSHPGDAVTVAAGTYLENLTVAHDLTLVGAGARQTVVDAAGSGVVVTVLDPAVVTLTGLEIRNGAAGGVRNLGTLTLTEAWVHLNGDGSPGSFGGLLNEGAAEVQRCTISGNLGDTDGGVGNYGQLAVLSSTIHGNGAAFAPGINNPSPATLALGFSTVAGNGAYGLRGGGQATASGTILSGHGAANCEAAVVTLGHNLEDGDSCGLDPAAGDLVATDPLLGALTGNGGPTPTSSLLSGSPAVDSGPLSGCPPTDQRGLPRPVDGNGDGTPACDIGAFELEPGLVFSDGFDNATTSRWSAVTP